MIMNIMSAISLNIRRKECLLFLVIIVAGLGIFGWITDHIILTSFSIRYKPISPIIATTFIALSILLYAKTIFGKSRIVKFCVSLALVGFMLFYGVFIIGYFLNFTGNIETFLINNVNRFGNTLTGRMSQVAAFQFFSICLSIILIKPGYPEIIRYISGCLALINFFISSVVIVAYLYKAPLLFGNQVIPVALPAGICFFLISIYLFRISELKFWTFNLIKENKISIQLLKSFLPFALFTVLLQGFLISNVSVSKASLTLFIALIAFIVALFIVISVIKVSSKLGDSLQKAEQVYFESQKNEAIIFYTRSLIETSLDPLFIISVDGQITDINLAAEIATGFSRNTLIGTDFCLYFTDPDEAEKGYKKVLEGGTVFDYSLSIRQKSGITIPVLFNANVYYSQSGKTLGVSATARDISKLLENENKLKNSIYELAASNEKLKKSEEEIRRLNTGLENEVEKRTADLVAMNKELEQFAYVAAHDLQEPLRMISSYTQLLERRYKDKFDDDANDFIHFIVDGAVRMQRLLNDLLDYSRVSSNAKDFEQVNTSLVLGNVILNLQQLINENSAFISNDYLPVVKSNESQIYQLFQNLIRNAIKFKKKSELPRIHISCERKNDQYEFSFRDNGIGIDMQYHDRIFIIFQRLHSSSEYVGTGIGLSVCKRIVERHRGKIWFESKENEGTTFYFTIPVLN